MTHIKKQKHKMKYLHKEPAIHIMINIWMVIISTIKAHYLMTRLYSIAQILGQYGTVVKGWQEKLKYSEKNLSHCKKRLYFLTQGVTLRLHQIGLSSTVFRFASVNGYINQTLINWPFLAPHIPKNEVQIHTWTWTVDITPLHFVSYLTILFTCLYSVKLKQV
jgi:hypothetical protein